MANKTSVAIAFVLAGAASAWAEGPMLAVSSRGDGEVNLYSVRGEGRALQLIKAVPVGGGPGEMCAAPDGKRLFASNPPDKNIAVIDVEGRTVLGKLSDPGMRSPDGCAVSPDSKKLYTVDPASETVFVFSVESSQMLKKIAVGKEPRRALFSPDGKRLLISNSGSNTLSVIDPSTDSIVRTVKTGTEPRDMTYSPDGKLLAVALIGDDSAAFFDAGTLEFKQQAASTWSPQHMEFSPDSRRLYVVGKISDEIAVMKIDKTNRLDGRIPIPHGPVGILSTWGMAMTDDGKILYVSNIGDDDIVVIDAETRQTFRAFRTGKQPVAVVYLKATGGSTGLPTAARSDHYRTLAQKAMDAVKKNEMAEATKLCQTLEQDYDEGEKALRQRSPEVWNQVDEAMDDFIHLIMRSGGKQPDGPTLDTAYKNFLAKLKLLA